MSFQLVDHLLKEGPANPMDKLVLVVIASFTDSKTGICNPSLAGIAERASMTERGARQIVRRLEAAGWLEIDVGGGRAGRSTYRINTERCSGFTDENTEHGSGYQNENPERGAPKPGTPCTDTRNVVHENPERGAPEPRYNQEENQEENREGGYPLPPAAFSDAVSETEGRLSQSTRRSSSSRRSEHHGEVLTPGDARELLDWLVESWPKKRPPKLAAAALEAVLLAGADPEEIEAGARAYLAERAADRRGAAAQVRFCAPLDKWLLDRRWLDHTAAPAEAVGGGDLGNGMSLAELIAAFGGGKL